MTYQLQKYKEEEELIKNIFEEVNGFFGSDVNYKDINIIFIPNRKTFDSYLERKTDEWEVAVSNNKRGIIILDRDNYEKESCHKYSEEEYNSVLKHEIVHAIVFIHFKLYFPNWLVEGLAIYLSEQIYQKQKPIKFEKFISYWDYHDKDIYKESGFVVKILLEKYGKKKFIKLLNSLKENESEKFFNKEFEKVYNFGLNYPSFNKLI